MFTSDTLAKSQREKSFTSYNVGLCGPFWPSFEAALPTPIGFYGCRSDPANVFLPVSPEDPLKLKQAQIRVVSASMASGQLVLLCYVLWVVSKMTKIHICQITKSKLVANHLQQHVEWYPMVFAARFKALCSLVMPHPKLQHPLLQSILPKCHLEPKSTLAGLTPRIPCFTASSWTHRTTLGQKKGGENIAPLTVVVEDASNKPVLLWGTPFWLFSPY